MYGCEQPSQSTATLLAGPSAELTNSHCRRELYELQRELSQERAAAEALGAARDDAAGRAGESERLLQGLVGAQAEGLKAQGALESQVGGRWLPAGCCRLPLDPCTLQY